MAYKYFTEKEAEYFHSCWESYKNEGNNYRKTIAEFNVDFYRNEFKPKFIDIDSYIGDIDDKYYSDSYDLKSKINKFLSKLNYKDDKLKIAREGFGFGMGLFEGFSMDVIDLIDYKFKSNQINTLEDAYNCYKEYTEVLGFKDNFEEYKENVENKIKNLKKNNTYDCSNEEREDVLLMLSTNRYMYFSLTKKKTKYHKLNLKHFTPNEAEYISDVFNEYQDIIRSERHYERSYYFGNSFLECFKKENTYLEKNFEERLEKKTFKNPKSEEYYNKIVEIFELEKVFKDDKEKKNYFNLLEFKFKVYNEESLGIYSIEQAQEICKDISIILEKENAIKVFESCYNIKPLSQNSLSNNTEDKYDYEEMVKNFEKYILGGTAEIYKYIIENKKYPEITTWQTLKMISEKKSDIIRFADCFEIKLKNASKIFGVKVEDKNRNKIPNTDFMGLLRKYNSQLYK